MIIFFPPDAPTTSLTSPLLSVKIRGVTDDNGRFPGAGKFTAAGYSPLIFGLLGLSKSLIWLLYMIPVAVERYKQPNLQGVG